MVYSQCLSKIDDVIEDIKQGKMVIIVDDEGRENEGDIVIAAEKASSEVINFMAKYARGLICTPITKKRAEELDLKLMNPNNNSRYQTAFTISVGAKEGTTTGISAYDRAVTIQTIIDPTKSATDLYSPGHVFPLIAKDGGVLVRAGHTEAAIDLALLAGLNPSAVICEVMKDDGTMARMPDLIKFAKEHDLKICTIADLIKYRRTKERLIEKVKETKITSSYGGEWNLLVYSDKIEGTEHMALVKGEIDVTSPVMVRMHALNVLSDVIAETNEDKGLELKKSMEMIANHGSGIVVIIRDLNKKAISKVIDQRNSDGQDKDLRDYGIGAQILLDINVKIMNLLTNSKKSIVALEGYGLKIENYIAIK